MSFDNDSILDSPKYNGRDERSPACFKAEVVRLKAENKRIHLALVKIVSMGAYLSSLELMGIAKKALEVKS